METEAKFRSRIPEVTVQELINSFVRLSAAMTVYSLQQMQFAVDNIDPTDPVARLKGMIDSMTDALTSQMNDSKKQTLDSMSNLSADVVGRTMDTLNVAALNPREIVQSTSDMVRKTTDSLANMMKTDARKPAGTPQAAGEVLAAH